MAKGKNKESNKQEVNMATKRTEHSEHQGKQEKNKKS
jgi:hypothetical protein